jgi:hypothetical protein
LTTDSPLKRAAIGQPRKKKEAVGTALEEYIGNRLQTPILAPFAAVDFDPEYDGKRERRRKRRDLIDTQSGPC